MRLVTLRGVDFDLRIFSLIALKVDAPHIDALYPVVKSVGDAAKSSANFWVSLSVILFIPGFSEAGLYSMYSGLRFSAVHRKLDKKFTSWERAVKSPP